jgi:hypothetical protein
MHFTSALIGPRRFETSRAATDCLFST